MSTEQCPQCQNPWPAGQETCPNCGYTMAASGAQFRTGETGIRPMPTMPEQGAAQPPPQPPAQPPQQAPGPPVVTPGAPPPVQYGQPYNPPGTPPPVQYGYQQQQAYMAQQQPARGLTLQPLVLIGAVLASVGGVLPWVGDKFLGIGGHTISSFKIPVNALWDLNAGDSGFKIG